LFGCPQENQALRAALVERGGVDTVNGQGISAIGEPAVLSQCKSRPMYAERLMKDNSLQLEYQQFPCPTATHVRRQPVRYAALLMLLLHLQCCHCHGWSHNGEIVTTRQSRVKMRSLFEYLCGTNSSSSSAISLRVRIVKTKRTTFNFRVVRKRFTPKGSVNKYINK